MIDTMSRLYYKDVRLGKHDDLSLQIVLSWLLYLRRHLFTNHLVFDAIGSP